METQDTGTNWKLLLIIGASILILGGSSVGFAVVTQTEIVGAVAESLGFEGNAHRGPRIDFNGLRTM